MIYTHVNEALAAESTVGDAVSIQLRVEVLNEFWVCGGIQPTWHSSEVDCRGTKQEVRSYLYCDFGHYWPIRFPQVFMSKNRIIILLIDQARLLIFIIYEKTLSNMVRIIFRVSLDLKNKKSFTHQNSFGPEMQSSFKCVFCKNIFVFIDWASSLKVLELNNWQSAWSLLTLIFNLNLWLTFFWVKNSQVIIRAIYRWRKKPPELRVKKPNTNNCD